MSLGVTKLCLPCVTSCCCSTEFTSVCVQCFKRVTEESMCLVAIYSHHSPRADPPAWSNFSQSRQFVWCEWGFSGFVKDVKCCEGSVLLTRRWCWRGYQLPCCHSSPVCSALRCPNGSVSLGVSPASSSTSRLGLDETMQAPLTFGLYAH